MAQTQRDRYRERIRTYFTGVAIGIMILVMAYLSRQMVLRRQQTSPPPPAAVPAPS